MHHITPQMVIGVVVLLALIAIVWAFVASEKKPRLSKYALTWLDAHFDGLLDESKKPLELVTRDSLFAADWAFDGHEDEMNHLILNIKHIGHEIDEDTDAKAAAAIAASTVSPIGTVVVASSFAVYGISREDLQRAIAIAVDDLG